MHKFQWIQRILCLNGWKIDYVYGRELDRESINSYIDFVRLGIAEFELMMECFGDTTVGPGHSGHAGPRVPTEGTRRQRRQGLPRVPDRSGNAARRRQGPRPQGARPDRRVRNRFGQRTLYTTVSAHTLLDFHSFKLQLQLSLDLVEFDRVLRKIFGYFFRFYMVFRGGKYHGLGPLRMAYVFLVFKVRASGSWRHWRCRYVCEPRRFPCRARLAAT